MNHIELKKKTIQEDNIVKNEKNWWCYVNHDEKLMTVGFLTREDAVKYQNIIAFDGVTVFYMRERYLELSGENK